MIQGVTMADGLTDRQKRIADLIGLGSTEDLIAVEPEKIGITSWKDTKNIKIVIMSMQGFSAKEIGKELDMDAQSVRNVMASDEYTMFREYITQEVVNIGRTFLAMSTVKAVKTLLDLLDSDNDKVRLGASKDVLDRVGLKSPDKIELLSKSDNIREMSTEQLFDILKYGQSEIMKALGTPIPEEDAINDGESESDSGEGTAGDS
jgi:DNA-binding CsgD family transcriptional regulator